MDYLRATFRLIVNNSTSEIRQTSYDLIASLAGECGFESFEDHGETLLGYVQKELFDKEQLEFLLDSFPMPGVQVTYSIEEIEQQDWNKPWEESGFDPIEIDGKCIIHDTKHPVNVPEGMVEVVIDACMSFGSGTHATTRMIVSEMLQSDLHDKRILDCGCGTGILSIVASKCGASSVVAYDIDEWCVKNTIHNAQLNNATNIEVLTGDSHVLSHISGVFDLVVANINRNILVADLPAMKEVLATKGKIVLSGFYEEDVPLLKDAARQVGLSYDSKREADSWVSLSFSS